MQTQREIFRRKPADQEHALLELAQTLPETWGAAHIHLSRISRLKRNENIVFALQMFENSVRGLEGRLLVLRNGDWVYLYPESRVGQASMAVSKLRRLFAADPLYYNEEKYESDFATWYVLARDRAAFVQAVEALAGAASTPPAVIRPVVVQAPPEPRIASQGSELMVLAQTVEAIERTNLAAFLRRQPVCTLLPGGDLAWLFDEFYFSILDLEAALNRSPLMTGDPIFLQYLTKCLDRKLVALLRPACQGGEAVNLNINLNVASVLSPEFTDFDAAISAESKPSIGLEFQFIDVFSDLGVFAYVRGFLRERGYRLYLDGLTDANLGFADPDRLGIDRLKIRWAAGMDGPGHDDVAEMIQAVGPERAILCRCDSGEAVDYGKSVGLTMFQGRHVTELLRAQTGIGPQARVFSLQQ